MIASALIAAIGKAEAFEHGRDLSAWLGLVPRQSTTGGKPRLFGISKRGNKYLRKLLIHGARAALPHIAERDTALGRWAKGLLARVHQNVAVVALANKLARIAWAVLRRGETFTVGGTISRLDDGTPAHRSARLEAVNGLFQAVRARGQELPRRIRALREPRPLCLLRGRPAMPFHGCDDLDPIQDSMGIRRDSHTVLL